MTQKAHETGCTRRALGRRLRAYADQELALAIKALGRRGRHRHEGVHQARRHLQRVRAVLALARKPLDQLGRILNRRLRRIVRGLSRVRDAQAMLETLDRLSDEVAPQLLPRYAVVRAAVRRERDAVMAALLGHDPSLTRNRHQLQTLREQLNEAAWSSLRTRHVESALSRSKRRLRKAVACARDEDTPAHRHRWRRRGRRLRQQNSALAAAGQAYGKAKIGPRRCNKLLGEEHDLAVLWRHLSVRFRHDSSNYNVWHAVIKAAVQRRRTMINTLKA